MGERQQLADWQVGWLAGWGILGWFVGMKGMMKGEGMGNGEEWIIVGFIVVIDFHLVPQRKGESDQEVRGKENLDE